MASQHLRSQVVYSTRCRSFRLRSGGGGNAEIKDGQVRMWEFSQSKKKCKQPCLENQRDRKELMNVMEWAPVRTSLSVNQSDQQTAQVRQRPPLRTSAEGPHDHRGRLRVTKMSTLRMAMRRSLSEVIARMVSWARFSNGRTARSHQHQAGPLGVACRRTRTQER